MASSSKSLTIFVSALFAIALALLLATCMAASDFSSLEVPEADKPLLKCQSTHAVLSGETCFTIAKQFNLTTIELLAINPNIVCDKLLVGEWLCVVAGEGN
ncbi:hypothetical protein MLD38_010013 [Melastoma candidum]|uniref:Uncharacterized protein n=1 Tax=Melastoma candidum TaxID=119954 RepID=A0ACB9QZ14_9MYRT|nr:hypothetical protein MLD38_010013 [Melastoma candidum]